MHHTLYDSDAFLVNHMLPGLDADDEATVSDRPVLLRHGFEIVDKRTGREIYLDGSWAELFQERLAEWRRNTPSQDEVEATLAQYAELATVPLFVH